MIRGFYKGIKRRLIGKTALLRVSGEGYLAQFDSLNLKESHGWYYFPKDDFEIEPEYVDCKPEECGSRMYRPNDLCLEHSTIYEKHYREYIQKLAKIKRIGS
jgi:hypothetical protein